MGLRVTLARVLGCSHDCSQMKNEQVAPQWTMGNVGNDNAGGVYLLVEG